MHLVAIGAGAALALLLSACGGSSGASPSSQSGSASCAGVSGAHHAYVVVEHQSKKTLQRCVGFSGATIDGDTLMKKSGIEFQTGSTSFGKAVCQIDQEPARYSTCFPPGQPFWSLWVDSGGSWSSAQVGYTQLQIHDQGAMGWEYVPQTGPSAPPPPLPRA